MGLSVHDVLRELVGAAAKAGSLAEGRVGTLLAAVDGTDPRVAEEAAKPPEFTPADQQAYDELAARRAAAQAPPRAAAGTAATASPGRSLFAPPR